MEYPYLVLVLTLFSVQCVLSQPPIEESFGEDDDAWKKNSKWVWKRPQYVMPWLKGPNVCAVEEVTGSRRRYYSECMTYMPRQICGKPTFIRYHCCSGFERTEDNSKGCQGVVPVTNLMETARNLYLREFRRYVKQAGLEPMLRDEADRATYTVFAPHNQAFNGIDRETRDRLLERGSRSLLRYHMVRGRHNLHQLHNRLTLPTLYQGQPDLKVNRYSNGIVTVNCARVIMPDQVATNGIIHVTEKVVEPIQDGRTLMEILLADDRFGELVTALIVTQLGNILRDKDRDLTLFAVTDAAFRNAPQEIVERILNDKAVLEKLLKYHMIDKSICSAAILGHVSQMTLEGQKVNLTCDVNDRLRVNNVRTAATDIVGANGVIHILDELLVPDSAKSLREVLVEMDLYQLIEYLQQAGAEDIMNGDRPGNWTILAPSAEAIRGLTRSQRRLLMTSPSYVRRIMNYHIIPGRLETDVYVGDRTVTPLGGQGRLHMTVHHRGFSVNGANIIESNHEAGNGVVHIIDRFLMKPRGSAIDKIKQEGELSMFLSLLQTSNVDSMLLDLEGNYTVFAPTNDAFSSLDRSYMDRLMRDQGLLTKFLQYHIIAQPVYTSTLKPKWQYRYQSLTGDKVKLQKVMRRREGRSKKEEQVIVNQDTEIMGSLLEAENGVVYFIDDILRWPGWQTYYSNNEVWEGDNAPSSRSRSRSTSRSRSWEVPPGDNAPPSRSRAVIRTRTYHTSRSAASASSANSAASASTSDMERVIDAANAASASDAKSVFDVDSISTANAGRSSDVESVVDDESVISDDNVESTDSEDIEEIVNKSE